MFFFINVNLYRLTCVVLIIKFFIYCCWRVVWKMSYFWFIFYILKVIPKHKEFNVNLIELFRWLDMMYDDVQNMLVWNNMYKGLKQTFIYIPEIGLNFIRGWPGSWGDPGRDNLRYRQIVQYFHGIIFCWIHQIQ